MFRVPDAASGPFLAIAAPGAATTVMTDGAGAWLAAGGPRQPPSASILRLSHGAW